MSDSNPLAGVRVVDAGHSSFTGNDVSSAADGGSGFSYVSGSDYGENPFGATVEVRVSETAMPIGRGGGEVTPSYGDLPFAEGSDVHYPVPTSTRLRRV